MANHVVLIGDSIFDNGMYVPGGPPLIKQLQPILPKDWQASLVAVDGAVVSSVHGQLERLPDDTTHLVLSVGGNNALGVAYHIFNANSSSVRQSLGQVADAIRAFRKEYRALLEEILLLNLPLTVCTIYDHVPGLGDAEMVGLTIFNDIITRNAFEVGARLIDLRIVCKEETDYSSLSPIEPSVAGGAKIARAIAGALLDDHSYRRVIIGY